MSLVTNAVLFVDEAPEEVREALLRPCPLDHAYGQSFGLVAGERPDGTEVGGDLYGGRKTFVGHVYVAAFQGIGAATIIAWLESLPWEDDSSAHLAWSEAGDWGTWSQGWPPDFWAPPSEPA